MNGIFTYGYYVMLIEKTLLSSTKKRGQKEFRPPSPLCKSTLLPCDLHRSRTIGSLYNNVIDT
jgi:hypothetical protein